MSHPKILHYLSGGFTGGAGRMALSIHQGLLEQNQDSHLVTAGHYDGNFKNVYSLTSLSNLESLKLVLFKKADRLPLRLYPQRTSAYFSPGVFGLNIDWLIKKFNPDILHLHWVCDGAISIESLSKVQIPIVWTLHDQWPMTGGCHYTASCEGFKTGCGACPALGSKKNADLSRRSSALKKEHFKRIHFVAISEWMKGEALKSTALGGAQIRVIYNGIRTERYGKSTKTASRQKLNLPEDRKIVLFGAHNLQDPRKNFALLRESLSLLPLGNRPLLLFFGEDQLGSLLPDFECHSLGYIDDSEKLSFVYQASDLFVSLAKQEGYGLTIAESLASGLPVVTLKGTGSAELLKTPNNGTTVGSAPNEVALAIQMAMNLERETNCSLSSEFHLKACVDGYLTLYRKIN